MATDAELPPLGTLARSIALFRAFRLEQTEPATFYRLLARDSVRQVGAYTPLRGAHVIDVGGGPGYFAEAFREAGALYVGLDADVGELSLHGRTTGPDTVIGSGTRLPFVDGATDIAYSSNVLEHVSEPERMADELVRVTRPDGLVFLSYNNWLAPNGGHETAPWHYFGGHFAARRYTRRTGQTPKNEFGRTLFVTSIDQMLRWTKRQSEAGLVIPLAIVPRYHPRWARWVVRVPLVREVATWNLLLVLRRTAQKWASSQPTTVALDSSPDVERRNAS